jgi:hypothetical protein
MGTTASRSSLNLPSSCTTVRKETTTKLFTVPDYSKWARMPAGSVLKFRRFSHHDGSYRLKVYPAGFDEESAGYVAIFVAHEDFLGARRFDPAIKVLIEILDVGGQRAVFDNHTTRTEQTLVDYADGSKGYIRFVTRTELEEASCVRADDTFTVRCTLSVDVKTTKKVSYASKRAGGGGHAV